MQEVLEMLRKGLVVSCQPVDGGPLDEPEIVARFAQAALAGGASGLRIEGADNLRAVREATSAPIIGLIKSDRNDTEIRITSMIEDVDILAAEGADIIAFDATDRIRPVPREDLIARIQSHGKIAMADCCNHSNGQWAADLDCEILGSTMSGYVGASVPTSPDLDLVQSLASLEKFVVAEGRYNRPDLAKQAIIAGADAVVVGSAITRPEHVTSWFAKDIHTAVSERDQTQ